MAELTVGAPSAARLALESATQHLLALQDEAGWWRGELQTNVTMDAEDMLLREFLGVRREEESERSAAWIRSQQRSDGTWANFHGGPGELSTTIEAYWALRLAGDDPAAAHMRAAAAFIRSEGGLERARVFTHLWLALFGLWSWDRVPALPPEIILLPASVPLNVYDFACWARQTIVALSLVKTHRPVRALPFDLAELHGVAGPRPPRRPLGLRASWLARLDRVLRAYERRPLGLLRRVAVERAEHWIVRRQEADGSWGGIQPPWVYSLIALHLGGYQLDHPVMRRGLEGIERFMVEDRDDAGGVGAPPGTSRRLEACQSPVWDTALAMVALSDAGLECDHPAMLKAGEWLLDEEVSCKGDWSVARPHLAPGGWAFEFENVNYPDVDDTVEVVLALKRLQPPAGAGAGSAPAGAGPALNGASPNGAGANGASRNGGEHNGPSLNGAGANGAVRARITGPALARRIDAGVERAVRWVEGMQSCDGGWGAFDADNVRAAARELPFLDFGEVIDQPSADVTAHTVEMLAALGLTHTPAARRGVRWLIDNQEPSGSWFGRWGINHVYGTGAAVPALVAAGVEPSAQCVRRAVAWLERHQNEDGGWGEDPRSYDDELWIGRGPSTASQTAWALLALHAAGERSPALAGGVDWLVATQRPDGTWDEPQYTGTGFPCDYYINYHLYRLTFPLMALARCLAAGLPGGESAQAGTALER